MSADHDDSWSVEFYAAVCWQCTTAEMSASLARLSVPANVVCSSVRATLGQMCMHRYEGRTRNKKGRKDRYKEIEKPKDRRSELSCTQKC